MEEQVKSSAWALGLWGVLSIIFGVLIVAWPGITLRAFLIVLGIYLLAVGAVALIGSVISRTGHWVLGMLLGGLSFVAGLYVFANPDISAVVILSLIAIWAIVVGVLLIVAGFEADKDGIWLVLAGLVTGFFGFYIFANPGEGALVLIWLISIYSIVSGILLTIGGFKLHSASKELAPAKK